MKSQCFPDQWVLLMVLATVLYFQFKVSSVVLGAATLTAASTREAKMLISQTVPIGITPWSAGGEG